MCMPLVEVCVYAFSCAIVFTKELLHFHVTLENNIES